ncbi:maleylpyruvate isomerase family mycothiol-dependent enzyme [Hoyosella altamirensis]|uniref:Uncharacterized protein (TIGR03083 family) n=1 Tax=Hoyosella altamirensis TaxID=616997 RepID=A0A839RKS0_9ACTN|nr:maleylpyruvate isomerase family mycothiol-dependent enzyme [Hoyosella altamirensis]MBB3036987.1 uncharacterized protein (TIGR03083 family) [Hoyosella altamirensis]
MTSGSLAALRAERQAILEFCSGLTTDDWAAASMAQGWTVKDVVTHMAASLRTLITPAAIPAMATKQIERLNDRSVDKSRSRSPEQVLDDFTSWTRRGIIALNLLTAPAVGRLPLPVGELGRYPIKLFPAMYVFDWHTHLRHDIAPSLERPAPPTDKQRMTAMMAWLTKLLEQSHRKQLAWLDATVSLTLHGPGGGTWQIEPLRDGGLHVRTGTTTGAVAHIIGQVLEFPVWGTGRVPWRSCDITLRGDTDVAERLLDNLDLV